MCKWKIILVTGYCDSQIYARNPIGPAEKDLVSLCRRISLYIIMRSLFDVLIKEARVMIAVELKVCNWPLTQMHQLLYILAYNIPFL